LHEKAKKQAKTKLSTIKVKSGTVDEFFANVKDIMRSADKGESIKKRCAVLTFADPSDMLHFLSASKIQLIKNS
jgi:predicted transcriptional regulator